MDAAWVAPKANTRPSPNGRRHARFFSDCNVAHRDAVNQGTLIRCGPFITADAVQVQSDATARMEFGLERPGLGWAEG